MIFQLRDGGDKSTPAEQYLLRKINGFVVLFLREWFSYMQYGYLPISTFQLLFRCWLYLTFSTTGIQISSSEFGSLFLYFSPKTSK
ncbi:MAG: hypothetical protein ACI9V1_000365 [Spirosomataceae bacterium]|jgi:hypothetical protein